jgi:MFS family permease
MLDHALPAARCKPALSQVQCDKSAGSEISDQSVYGVSFWAAYISYALVNIAIALWFRFSDFIEVLGGTELHLGWIVGIGMVGSIAMRLLLGRCIDQYGSRRICLLSCAVFAASCFAHLGVSRCDGLAIYALRIIQFTALAGYFGACTAYISLRVPENRIAEIIGLLGTAGFVGVIGGTFLADLICGPTANAAGVTAMFLVGGALATLAFPFAWYATRDLKPPKPHDRPPMFVVLRHYNPGMVLAVGAVAGAAIVLPQAFLRTFAGDLGIPRIWWFFFVVSVMAIGTRVVTLRAAERFGLEAILLIGLGVMTAAQMLFLTVSTEWQLVFPAVAHGMAQAVLFPVVTALISCAFPTQYRGLGMTMALASLDVGQLVGAPLAGVILHCSVAWGLPGYPTVFCVMAATLLLVIAAYAWSLRRRVSFLAWFASPEIALIPDEPAVAPSPRAAVHAASGKPVDSPCFSVRQADGSNRSSV